MAVQMTRAEYEAKYGQAPQSQAPMPVRMTRAEYEAKYGGGSAAGGPSPSGVSDKIVDLIGARGVTDLLGSQFAKLGLSLTGNMDAAKYVQEPKPREVAGSALQLAATFTPVGRVAGGLTKAATMAGLGKAAPALGSIGAGALTGAGFDVAQNVRSGAEGMDIFKPGVGAGVGAAIPVVGLGAGLAARGVQKAAPKLLSYTSDVPEEAFKVMMERRGPVAEKIKAGTSGQEVLRQTQDAVRGLRTTLSTEWDEASAKIYKEFTGKRWGMSGQIERAAQRVVDDFGITLPQNTKNISAKETIDLLKEINELYSKRAVKESAQGIAVRKFKELLQSQAVQTFGGKGGSLDLMYKNYAAKKGVLDAANDIVRAYSTGKPISQSTALGRLKTLFNENKVAYLDAIVDLEKATGRDILSGVTALQFSQKLPVRSPSRGFAHSALDKAIDLLILPLSSPRSAGFIARAISGVNKGTSTGSKIVSPGDALLNTTAGGKLSNTVASSLKNPSLGLAVKDVTRGIDKATKQEMIDAIDYIRVGKSQNGYNQKMEQQIGDLADYFGITDKTLGGVANKFETLVQKTKTMSQIPPVTFGKKVNKK